MRKTIISHAAWLRSRPFVITLSGLLILCSMYLLDTHWPAMLSRREFEAVQASGLVPAGSEAFMLRFPAAIAAMASVALLYGLVRRWHGRRVAVMTAVLFATSGWMLHTARSGLPLVWYGLVPLSLFAFGSWLNTTKRSRLAVSGGAILLAGLAYIPGAIWFELFALIMLAPVLRRHCQAAGAGIVGAAGTLMAVILGWLAFSLVRAPELISRWLGVHGGFPEPVVLLKQWAMSAGFLVRGPLAPDLWLGRAPLLDVFSLVVLALGVYIYIRHPNNLRARLIAGFTVIASLLIAVNGLTGISYILPMVYFLVAAGITSLLHEWYVIFPRNPVARVIGTAAVVVAVLCACTYHLSAYFIAWQRAPETAQAFDRPLP